MTELPAIFALKRYRPDITETYPELTPYKDYAVLISATKGSCNTWTLNIIEYPELIINDSLIVKSSEDKWFNNNKEGFNILGDDGINEVVVVFNQYVIKYSSEVIPLLKMSKPCVTLQREFFNLYTEECSSFRFNFVTSDSKSHKYSNKDIDELIAKNETCPVFMVGLTRANTRITSCGHVISVDVEKWINEKGTCPLCRKSQKLSDLSRII